jgi:hypothetical protein
MGAIGDRPILVTGGINSIYEWDPMVGDTPVLTRSPTL